VSRLAAADDQRTNIMASIPPARSILALLAFLPLGVAAQTVTLLTEEAYPFQYLEDQRLTGAAVEVVGEMFRRAGLGHKDELLPWNEAYRRALASPLTCVYSTARTKDREGQFKWVGPIVVNKWAFFARKGFADPIGRPTDLKQYRIGVLKADAKERYLDGLGVLSISSETDDAANPPRLTLDRNEPDKIDLWVTGYYAGAYIAAKAGVTGVVPVRVFHTSQNYLACHPSVPEVELGKMQAALDAMKRDGTHGKIVAKYVARLKVK
jgi:polar amino acid transport system substrate-binding protein